MEPSEAVFNLHHVKKKTIKFNVNCKHMYSHVSIVQLESELHGTHDCCDHDRIQPRRCPTGAREEKINTVALCLRRKRLRTMHRT